MVESNSPDFKHLDELGKVDSETGCIRPKEDDSKNCKLISEFV